VDGWTQCSVTSLQYFQATCALCTVSVTHEMTNMYMMTDSIYTIGFTTTL
jgi:hypothetical protein